MKGVTVKRIIEPEVIRIPVNKVKIGKNSRLSIKNDDLIGLMQSIKEVGLLQPIGVVKRGAGYEVVYGNRRFLAYSKLGKSTIPAIVQEGSTAAELDVKNLAENVQRANISLAEVGRYIEILKEEGMSSKEIAVRLGVSKNYVDSAVAAYKEVPEKFRKDLAMEYGAKKIQPGKISIKAARAIVNAAKTLNLRVQDQEKLFEAAKHADGFTVDNVQKYATTLKSGEKDFMKKVKKLKTIRLNFMIEEDHYDHLLEKYVANGPFRSVSALMHAILKGEVHCRVKFAADK